MDAAARTVILGLLAQRPRTVSVNVYQLARDAWPMCPHHDIRSLALIAAEELVACGIGILWEPIEGIAALKAA